MKRLTFPASCITINSKWMSTFRVMSKGNGVYGALGQGESLRDSPNYKNVVLPLDDDNVDGVTQVSAGWGHSAIVTRSGKLFVFGRPYDFSNLMQLNRLAKLSKSLSQFVAKSTNSSVFGSISGYFATPIQLHNVGIAKSVACSAGLTVVLNTNGEVFGFGQNRWKQCGSVSAVTTDQHILQPKKIENLHKCKQIDVGLQHGVALTVTGEVYAWGKSARGQLGIGNSEELSHLPTKVFFGHNIEAVSVCAGFGHSAALTADGALYIWGKCMSLQPKRAKGTMICCHLVNLTTRYAQMAMLEFCLRTSALHGG